MHADRSTIPNGAPTGAIKSDDTSAIANGQKSVKAEIFNIVQIGCGVVGHAYAQAFVNAGHTVHGVEANHTRIAQLQDAYPMHHISEDLSVLRNLNFILLSINTPLDATVGALNMRYIWNSLTNVSAMLSSNPKALIVVRSTVTIGFCSAYRTALEDRVGHAVRLCFQPEFLRAKSALEDATHPWQVVLGCRSSEEVKDYFEFQTGFISRHKIVHCTIDEAEIMKIFHNSFNAMKISYFNQANLLVEQIKRAEGKDIDAAKTFKIIGRTCEGLLNPQYGLTPGHAYYGTCLPKDSAELAHMEQSFGLECALFRAVVHVNDVVKATDTEEVLHGDNHARNEAFHSRLPTGAIPTVEEEAGFKDKIGRKDVISNVKAGVVSFDSVSTDGMDKAENKGEKMVESPSTVQAEWDEMHARKQEVCRDATVRII